MGGGGGGSLEAANVVRPLLDTGLNEPILNVVLRVACVQKVYLSLIAHSWYFERLSSNTTSARRLG